MPTNSLPTREGLVMVLCFEACHKVASVVVMLVLVVGLADHARAKANPYVRNPVGSATVPQSSLRGGLVGVPNPVDTTGNLIMTGNIRGGKSFQGPMPYRSTTGFGTSLGSSSLDSFLRDSAGPEDIGEYVSPYRGDYRPFYSPTGTVTMSGQGYNTISPPASPRIVGRVSSPRMSALPDSLSLGQMTPGLATDARRGDNVNAGLWNSYRLRDWPVSRTPLEMEQMISDELGEQSPGEATAAQQEQSMGTERYRQQMQQIREKLESISNRAQELREGMSLKTESSQLSDTVKPEFGNEAAAVDSSLREESGGITRDVRRLGSYEGWQKTSTDLVPRGRVIDSTQGENGIVEKPKQVLAGLPILENEAMEVAQSTDSGRLPTGAGADEPQKKSYGELPALERIRQTAKAFDDVSKQQTTKTSDFTELAPQSLQKLDQAEVGNSTAVDRIASVMERMTRLSGPRGKAGYTDQEIEKDQSATSAKADATKRTPFESFSKEKYERYMSAAQGYMKQGRFYRAADAYALASLYRPDDPFAYAGRAHALFAAGEYVSSAIFLSRCLEISPDYMLQKVNLVGMTGSPVIFEQRLTDLERCAKIADAPEMNLLLAYVYYRVGELDQARDAIDRAYKVLGNVPAVLAIKRAVEGVRPSGTK